MKTLKSVILFSLFCSYSSLLFSTIINIPADQPTIQAGIDASANGDTVLVQPWTYFENINYNGHNITVASLFFTTQDTSYISQTVIDGNQEGSVVTFESEEDSTAFLCGFTITNGEGGQSFNDELGGGITCKNFSDPIIMDSYLTNNYSYYGGGMHSDESNPQFLNVIISNNTAINGGGIYCDNSGPSLENVIIAENSASYRGGGIYCDNSSLNLENVTLKNNVSEDKGGGICIRESNSILMNVMIKIIRLLRVEEYLAFKILISI